jgi:hypothetical protein
MGFYSQSRCYIRQITESNAEGKISRAIFSCLPPRLHPDGIRPLPKRAVTGWADGKKFR